MPSSLARTDFDVTELLRLFYLGRPVLTVDAYQRDLVLFAEFTAAPSIEHAVHALLQLPKPSADMLAHEWASSMVGASATRARRLGALRGLVKTAKRFGFVAWELDVKSPVVKKFKDTAGPGVDALGAMLLAADGLSGQRRLRARVVMLLLSTLALRREEVAKLRIGSFDERRKKLYVVGKNRREDSVTLPEELVEAIVEWINTLAHRERADFLIQRLDKPGVGVTGQTIYKIVTMLGGKAGVRTWPHGIRHTSVTEVTRKNGLIAASKFARHSDVKTTMIYQDHLEDLAGVGAKTMEKILKQRYENARMAEIVLKQSFTREASQKCWDALRDSLQARGVEPYSATSFCWYCGQKEGKLYIEHMVPRSCGGADEAYNLAVACPSCNTTKSSSTALGYKRLLAARTGIDIAQIIFAGEKLGLMQIPPDPPPEEPSENPFDPDNNAAADIGL